MNRRSRWMVLAGIVLFVGLALWWSVWFPYRPERVRGAIPAHAVLVGEVHHLATDAQQLLHTPAVRESIHVLGGDVDAIDTFMARRFGRWLTACLGGRHTVIAFAPRAPRGAPAAWMAASWGGPRAQIIRWLIEGGWMAGWERLPGRSPVRCYVLKDAGNGPRLSAAVYDGVVLLAYSRDPGAVRRMVRQLAYGQPASRLTARTVPPPKRIQVCWMPQVADAPCADYTWTVSATGCIELRTTCPTHLPIPIIPSAAYPGELPRLAPGFVLPAVDPPGAVALSETEQTALSGGLGPLSGALVLAPAAVVDSLLRADMPHGIGRLYHETIAPRMAPDGIVAIGLLHEAYSGRLLGIKTPSLVLAVKTVPDFDLAAELPPLLDRWNAQLGVSLMARERGGAGILIIDEARNGIYASMKASEKPALWQSGGWLFVASNLAAAREVRRALTQPAAAPQGDWWQTAGAAPERVHGWCDFAAAGSAVRKLAALYAIVQIAQGERSGPAVGFMEHTGRVVSALEPFGEGSLHLEVGPRVWTMNARLGR